jgi:hypothetical protein
MISLLISSAAFITFTALLYLGKLGEATYAFLVAVTALFGLVLHGFGRLQELDLKNLRLVLRELQETKREIFVREEELKAVSVPLVQILAYQSAASGRWSDHESTSLSRAWYKKKIEGLIAALDVEDSQAVELRKFIEKYEEIDRLFAGRGALNINDPDYAEVKAKIDLLNSQVRSMLRKDLEGGF